MHADPQVARFRLARAQRIPLPHSFTFRKEGLEPNPPVLHADA